ncbi:MAG: phytanoyl-CoA dioxygenase family protein, partial [Burkholderiales bacterium]
MNLTASQVEEFRSAGHLTVPAVFDAAEMDSTIAEIERWGEEFLADLPPGERRWYVDGNVKTREVLRKLDNPHHFRPAITSLARDPRLLGRVESLIGAGVSVCFSQIFFKAPEGGGPKPAHQDNFYFGPRDPEALVTAWVALDDATPENGCMYFG